MTDEYRGFAREIQHVDPMTCVPRGACIASVTRIARGARIASVERVARITR